MTQIGGSSAALHRAVYSRWPGRGSADVGRRRTGRRDPNLAGSPADPGPPAAVDGATPGPPFPQPLARRPAPKEGGGLKLPDASPEKTWPRNW